MQVRKIRSEMRMGRSIFDLPLRVTFYARVSTDKDEQLNSLENQVQYYTELIKSKENWSFVPGYIDEGISGTSTKKRDSFNRMIADARAGRFDFIITKEISRFSRSTLDSIRYTQELLEHDVGVLFQNDNINTLDTDSEFRLVVMAGVAQDEVRKLSERLKFGFRQAVIDVNLTACYTMMQAVGRHMIERVKDNLPQPIGSSLLPVLLHAQRVLARPGADEGPHLAQPARLKLVISQDGGRVGHALGALRIFQVIEQVSHV